jgi:heme A synthase
VALQQTRRTRITANLVGVMLFVQVILGGSSVVLGLDIRYHLVWGTLTFIVLVATTVLARKDFGTSSALFKVAAASIADFVVQGLLGLFALGSDIAVVVHLTNAFLLAVIVTYLISFADSADRASTNVHLQTKTASPGSLPS